MKYSKNTKQFRHLLKKTRNH